MNTAVRVAAGMAAQRRYFKEEDKRKGEIKEETVQSDPPMTDRECAYLVSGVVLGVLISVIILAVVMWRNDHKNGNGDYRII